MPIALLFISFVLYLFRSIYEASHSESAPLTLSLLHCHGRTIIRCYDFYYVRQESIMAFPVNGGTYNVILNVVSKKWAALAACLTMLSYVTTAVSESNS